MAGAIRLLFSGYPSCHLPDIVATVFSGSTNHIYADEHNSVMLFDPLTAEDIIKGYIDTRGEGLSIKVHYG